MPKITIYTSPICPYCVRAKSLLKKKGAPYEEVDVFMDADRRAEMEEKSGGRHTVPQIFIGEKHVGGFDDLNALDRAGELDPLLASAERAADPNVESTSLRTTDRTVNKVLPQSK